MGVEKFMVILIIYCRYLISRNELFTYLTHTVHHSNVWLWDIVF